MIRSKSLQDMLEMAEEAADQMNKNISIFDKTLEEAIAQVPNEDKAQLEEVRALCTRAINLAKKGDAKEAQEILRRFQDGSKNSRSTVS